MFPECDVCYGLGDDTVNKYGNYTGSVKRARKLNPMEDKQISELVFDVLCLIYSADWYKSGDTGEDCYRKDLKFFKQKWLNLKPDELIRREIEENIEETREDLLKSFFMEDKGEDAPRSIG